MKKIVIVGGGTAGWMSALIMARQFENKDIQIELMESPDVGIIGVGEGSTPSLKVFFESQGIPESEWMPECNATYKCGIDFDGWSTKHRYEKYFHPFYSSVDDNSIPIFMHNAQARVTGLDLHAHPDRYFVESRLARRCLAPVAPEDSSMNMNYGYHFDAALVGKFLRKKAIERGVIHRICHVSEIRQDASGNIAAVLTDEGETHEADFFVDCTGFASLLLQKTLKTPFKSYSNLLNDSAVAMPTDIGDKIPSQTISTALKNGWAWKIPLTNRYGNGYVYSSSFCTAEEAEHELREHLGLLESDVPARHLKMKVGRVEQHWVRNCLGVGLSQGFIEPLEATALLLVQKTAEMFAFYFEKAGFSDLYRDEFNQRINDNFDAVRDYIVTHYKLSSRTDTEYWKANTADQQDVSDTMLELYDAWLSGKDLVEELHRLKYTDFCHYPPASWYCIFAGMGFFPKSLRLRKANRKKKRYDLGLMDDFLRDSANQFTDHRTFLEKFQDNDNLRQ